MAAPNTPAALNRSSNNASVGIAIPRNTTGATPAGYKLYHSTDNVSFSELIIAHTTVGAYEWYPHHGLTNGTTHYYKATAYNDDGESSATAVVVGLPVDVADASTYVWLQFYNGDLPALTLVAGQSYRVDVGFSNDGTSTWTFDNLYRLAIQPIGTLTWGPTRLDILTLDDAGNVPSFGPGVQALFTATITAPSTPGTYSFKWKTAQEWRYPSGQFGDTTPDFQILVVLLPPSAPTGLLAIAGEDRVDLSWVAPVATSIRPAATSYTLYRSTARRGPMETYPQFPGLVIPSGPGAYDEVTLASGRTSLAYADTTAENGTEYTYRVSASNDWGEGDKSYPSTARPHCCIAQYPFEAGPASTLQTEAGPSSTLATETGPSNTFAQENC